MLEPTAYDLITKQLARIEGKLDKLPEQFLGRQEYEKRHNDLLELVKRTEDGINGDIKSMCSEVEDLSTKVDELTRRFWMWVGGFSVIAIVVPIGITALIWFIDHNAG